MIEGNGQYQSGEQTAPLAKGETILIPASSPEVLFTPSGNAVWLEISTP